MSMVKTKSMKSGLWSEKLKSIAVKQAVFFLAGLAASSVSAGSVLSPYGIGLVGMAPLPVVPAGALGVLAGHLWKGDWESSLKYGLIVLVIFVLRFLFSGLKKLRSLLLSIALTIAAPIFAVIVLNLSEGPGAIRVVLAAMEGIMAVGGGFCLRSAGMQLLNQRRRPRGEREYVLLLVSLAIVFAPLTQLEIDGFSPARVLVMVFILACGKTCGVIGGIASGLAFGMVMGMNSGDIGYLPAAYTSAGIIAALTAEKGRLIQSVSFVAGTAISLFAFGSSLEVVSIIFEAVTASLLYFVLPGYLVEQPVAAISPVKNAVTVSPADLSKYLGLAEAFREVKTNLEHIAGKLAEHKKTTLQDFIGEELDSVCSICKNRYRCWTESREYMMGWVGGACRSLQKNNLITSDEAPVICKNPDGLTARINKAYQSFCNDGKITNRSLGMRAVVCDQFDVMAGLLETMVNENSANTVQLEDTQNELVEMLQKQGGEEVSALASYDDQGRLKIQLYCSNLPQLKFTRQRMSSELEKVCHRRMGFLNVRKIGKRYLISAMESPVFTAEFGSTQRKAPHSDCSGDSAVSFYDDKGRVLSVICDGMGTGSLAAIDGRMASSVFEQLASAGLDFDLTLKCVNAAMLVKSDDESLATVDAVRIDLYNGSAEFYKAGAAVSFVLHRGKVLRMEGSALPVGIIRGPEFDKLSCKLSAGDVVLMLSDGAAFDEQFVIEQLEQLEGDLQSFCDNLALELEKRQPADVADDITVSALRLKNARAN